MVNRLRELRKKKKYTLDDIEAKTGVKRGTYNNYESGKTEPKPSTWEALANFFNVSVPYLKGYGYSKEYIYKCLDDAYKENWKDPTGQITGGGFRNTVDAYLKQAKIKKPSNIDNQFWKDHFNFIFDSPNIERLLTTKDKYNDDDIKLLLEYTIFLNFTAMKQIIDFYNNN
ncbi:helix-turn-helix domain-containing protein [Lactobacillus amylovorus]|uniref:helix-turn-helix domain-containing protein n=1 Tax=Lactobacillus amylovorus TaxID=1604 RepID=UPI00232B18C7|nr:helix-turn-helix transcriptional regulator [Lactobacillus amylovorus]MDB6237735.1 helix-turn-helix domain-containing protein [Lactobacillus amylovorus]